MTAAGIGAAARAVAGGARGGGGINLTSLWVAVAPTVQGAAKKMKEEGVTWGLAAAQGFAETTQQFVQTAGSIAERSASTFNAEFNNALNRSAPDVGGMFTSMNTSMLEATQTALTLGGAFEKLPGTLGAIGGVWDTTIGAMVGAAQPFLEVGATILQTFTDIGNEWQKISRDLVGQTDDMTTALTTYKGVLRDIAVSDALVNIKDVSENIGKIGSRIPGMAENTDLLKDFTTTYAEAIQLMQSPIDAEQLTGTLNAFQIPAEDAERTLTQLVNTLRSVGQSPTEFMTLMDRWGGAVRAIGLDIGQTATMITQMSQFGVSEERLSEGFNTAISKLAEAATASGKEIGDIWDDLMKEASKRLAEDPSGEEVSALLGDLFGGHLATALREALQKGVIGARSDMEGFAEDAGRDISDALAASMTLEDAWGKMGDRIRVALEPVGTELVKGVMGFGETVGTWIEENQTKIIEGSFKALNIIIDGTQVLIDITANALKASSWTIEAIVDTVLVGLQGIVGTGKLITQLIELMPGDAPESVKNMDDALGKLWYQLDQLDELDLDKGIDDFASAMQRGNVQLEHWQDNLNETGDRLVTTSKMTDLAKDSVEGMGDEVRAVQAMPDNKTFRIMGDTAEFTAGMRQFGITFEQNQDGIVEKVNASNELVAQSFKEWYEKTTGKKLEIEVEVKKPTDNLGALLGLDTNPDGSVNLPIAPSLGGGGIFAGPYGQPGGGIFAGPYPMPGATPPLPSGGSLMGPREGGWVTGMPKAGDQAKAGVANYIYRAAKERGYTDGEAVAIVAYAYGESGLDPNRTGGVQRAPGDTGPDWQHEVVGLFQQKPGFAQAGGIMPNMRADVASNVTAYLNTLEKFRSQGIMKALPATSQGGPLATGADFDNMLREAQRYLGMNVQIPLGPGQGTTYTAPPAAPSTTTTTMPGTGSMPTSIPPMSGLDSGPTSVPAVQYLAYLMKQQFGGQVDLGGSRQPGQVAGDVEIGSKHLSGYALDIGIGSDQALGDQINAWVRANAAALGVKDTIWRDKWADFQGNTSTVGGHQDHVHVTFAEGGSMDFTPGQMSINMPGQMPGLGGMSGAMNIPAPTLTGNYEYDQRQVELWKKQQAITDSMTAADDAQRNVDKLKEDHDKAVKELQELENLARGGAEALYATDLENARTRERNTADSLNNANQRLTQATGNVTEKQIDYQLALEKSKEKLDKWDPDKNAEELGKGLVKGVLEGLGFDGSVFENPLEWGIWKLFTGSVNYAGGLMKGAGAQPTGLFGGPGSPAFGSPEAGGGGPSVMQGLLSGLIPSAEQFLGPNQHWQPGSQGPGPGNWMAPTQAPNTPTNAVAGINPTTVNNFNTPFADTQAVIEHGNNEAVNNSRTPAATGQPPK